jgi:IPT/TIG domain
MLVYAIHFAPGGAYVSAVALLALFFVLVGVVGRGNLSALVIGKDGRTSTSKVQALVWTLAVGFGVLALIFEGARDINIVPDYLYLLGFPALALMFSKSIVQQKLSSGDIVKVAPDATPGAVAGTASKRGWRDWLGDIVNNDAGQADIADFQYVLFNLIALIYFFIHLFGHAGVLPHIPQTLIVLTGASAGTYVGNKLVQNQTPVLSGVTPPSATPGTTIILHGTNLNTGGSVDSGGDTVTEVAFGDATVGVESATDSTAVVSVPEVTFADNATAKAVQISITNTVGSKSGQIAFTILAPPAEKSPEEVAREAAEHNGQPTPPADGSEAAPTPAG